MILSTVAGTGIEAASGLAGEIKIGRRELKSVVGASAASTITIFAGISVVALMADPRDGSPGAIADTAIAGQYVEKPGHRSGARDLIRRGSADALAYVVGAWP